MRHLIVKAVLFISLIFSHILHTPPAQVSPKLLPITNSIVMLTSDHGGCTGFQVAAPSGRSYIMTAGHCNILYDETSSITVTTEQGVNVQRRMVAESKGADLLLLEGVPGLPALQVAAADQPGELIKILGHGYLYPTWEIDGHIIGDFNTIAFFPIPFTETIISCEPAKGHSGSPALDPQGNVVGVVSMGAMGVGGLVRLQDIQAFLKGY